MSCEEWRPALMQAADNRLEALNRSERVALVAHLEQCAECRRALEDQRAVQRALGSRSDAEVPRGFTDRVLAAVDLERSASSPTSLSWVDMLRWRTWTFRLVPVATGLLVLGLVMGPNAPDSPESAVGLSELVEAWAFGEPDTTPVFTLWGQDDVAGDLLLDAILSAEPDEPLAGGDPS